MGKFMYLGSILSSTGVIDDEANPDTRKQAPPSADSARMCGAEETGNKVYKAVILTNLFHSCETWTVYQRQARTLNPSHTTSLRKLFGIKWQNKIPKSEVLTRTNLLRSHTVLRQIQLRWAGHVLRVPDHRFPMKILIGELQYDSSPV